MGSAQLALGGQIHAAFPYTIGEVCEKYHINDSSVWAHVRKYSIPSRQIGNYVYVPKEEIDSLSTKPCFEF